MKLNLLGGLGKMGLQTALHMLKDKMPFLAGKVAAMEKPVTDGGMLKEGEEKIAIVISQKKGDLLVSIHGMAYNPELGGMVMGKPKQAGPLLDVLDLISSPALEQGTEEE